jgi:hypothetical protein
MKRRSFLKNSSIAATFSLFPSAIIASCNSGKRGGELFVYIGTYTGRGSEGIYI